MAHVNDSQDPARVVEVVTVQGRNSWVNRLRGVLAGWDDRSRDPQLRTDDLALNLGAAPGRVNRLWYSQQGGMIGPSGAHSWPATYDVAYIPHIPIVRIPQRATPRKFTADTMQIPAVYVGNPL